MYPELGRSRNIVKKEKCPCSHPIIPFVQKAAASLFLFGRNDIITKIPSSRPLSI